MFRSREVRCATGENKVVMILSVNYSKGLIWGGFKGLIHLPIVPEKGLRKFEFQFL